MKQSYQEPSRASSTLAPRTPGNQEEHPGAQKIAMEALPIHYELTFSVWDPTGHVIYSQM
jgi:hypothetical protein